MTPEKKTLNEIWKAQRDTAIAIQDLTKALKDRPINLSIPGMMELKVPEEIRIEELQSEVLLALNQAEINAKGKIEVTNSLEIKNFPELQKIVGSVEAEIKDKEQLAIAIATQLAKVLPMPKEYPKEIDVKGIKGKVEIFGKTLTKIDNNTTTTPLYVQLVNGKKTIDIEELLKEVAKAASLRVVTPGGALAGSGGGGGGGGEVTIAGGGFVDFGAKADASATSDTGTFSFISLFKRSLEKLSSIVSNTSDISVSNENIDTNLGTQADATAGNDYGTYSLIALTKRLLQKFPQIGMGSISSSMPVSMPTKISLQNLGLTAVNSNLLTGNVGANDFYNNGATYFNFVQVTILTQGTITGGVLEFEQTDDTTNASSTRTWIGYENGNNQPTTQLTLSGATNKTFTFRITAGQGIRIRISSAITGGGSVGAVASYSNAPMSTEIGLAKDITVQQIRDIETDSNNKLGTILDNQTNGASHTQVDGTVEVNPVGILDSLDARIDPATEGTLSNLQSETATLRGIIENGTGNINVTATPQYVDRISFAKAISNNVDPDWGGIIGSIGAGQTVNQTGGNLLLVAGTTARSETILRSTITFLGSLRLKVRSTLSQRIANNNFFVELVDVVGDSLAYNITSATSMVVTFPTGTNPFTSANVGQSMYAGNFVGTGTFLSGRYTIASVSGDTVTFTVAGFAAGTGTLSLFGWNYYHLVYDGTTATQAKFDTQRKGYNSGDTTATINTTAAPGHLAIISGADMTSILSDQLVASSTAVRPSIRASRDENVPDDIPLFLQIRMANGSTAPASSTTWTVGYVSVSNYKPMDTVVQDTRQSTNTPIPVDITRSVALTTSTTITANQGTLASGTNYNAVTTASTNGASVKASAGNLFELTASNPTATPAFLKLYNKASAPTVGTDVPIVTIPVPANSNVAIPFGSQGKRFATGIAVAVTGAIGATDTTNAVAGVQINATYI